MICYFEHIIETRCIISKQDAKDIISSKQDAKIWNPQPLVRFASWSFFWISGSIARCTVSRILTCDQAWSPVSGRLEPYTLHPTPHTLHPTPFTLHPTPCTLHPTEKWTETATGVVQGGLLRLSGGCEAVSFVAFGFHIVYRQVLHVWRRAANVMLQKRARSERSKAGRSIKILSFPAGAGAGPRAARERAPRPPHPRRILYCRELKEQGDGSV